MADGPISKLSRLVRLSITVVVALYALAFVGFNAMKHSEIWVAPFVGEVQAPTLVVMIVIAALTVVLWSWGRLVLRMAFRGKGRA